MQRQSGWCWYGIDMEQAATYKYSEGDINSAKQFSKAAVLMCVRVGAHTHHDLEEEDLTNHDKSVTDANTKAKDENEGKKKRLLQSPQHRRKFAKGGMSQEEVGMREETQNAGDVKYLCIILVFI